MRRSLVYIDSGLDRAAHRRTDAAWLADRLGHAHTRVVPVWRDRNLVVQGISAKPVYLTEAAAAAAMGRADVTAFLGIGPDDDAWFACGLSAGEDPPLADVDADGEFVDLGRVVTVLPGSEAAVLAYAKAVVHWHRRHRFCGACGAPTESRSGGHIRVCTAAGCATEHFPRVDPVVIMLVTGGEGVGARCLLARQARWIDGLFSALAGFVEPGETLEDAVRREVREEVGIAVEQVAYRQSQPWPFPSSLMVGFRVRATEGSRIEIDRNELEDARWFTRDEVARIRALGLRLPFHGTIARALIEEWLAEGGCAAG